MYLKDKNGFTLAETLITLVIIGVVAALTIPTLVAEYKKRVLVEQLKVAVSIFDNGFKQAMSDDGVADLRDTKLFRACDVESTSGFQWNNNCVPYLKRYFNMAKIETVSQMTALGDNTNIITNKDTCKNLVGVTNKWYYLNDKNKCRGWKNLAFTLANGIRADLYLSDKDYFAGYLTALDVNGSKPPNTWGRDTFYMVILTDGRLTPYYGYEWLARYMDYYNEQHGTNFTIENNYMTAFTHWRNSDLCSTTTTAEGVDCAARVIESGWKMDY